MSLVPHLIRREANLEQEYKGHTFSEADKSALKNYGNMGRVVDLLNDRGERVPSIISIDRQTNEITDLPVRRLRIPEKIGNTELTKQEQDMLRAGLPLKNKEIELANGRKFLDEPSGKAERTTTLQANVEEKGVEFVPRGIRRAMQDFGIRREDIFVTSKLWTSSFNRSAQRDDLLAKNADYEVDERLERLGLDYIDLLLLHHTAAYDEEAYHYMVEGHADGYKFVGEPNPNPENKQLLIIPDASHCDLYDGGEKSYIPFDKLEAFFRENMK